MIDELNVVICTMKGIITPIITPFKKGRIDAEAIDSLIHYLENINVKGIFPAGSAGGFPYLSFSQHSELLDMVFSRTGHMKIFAGISRNSIDETIAMGNFAANTGIDTVVVVTPYYIKPDQESIYNYYATLAQHLKSDIIVYNIPQFTGVNINPDTLRKLMEQYSSIKGIKDSSGDVRLFWRYIRDLPVNALVYQGQDDLLLSSLQFGCTGGVCGTTNITDLAQKLFDTAFENKREAIALHRSITSLMDLLAEQTFPKSLNYLFQRFVIKRKKPAHYMVPPLTDLPSNLLSDLEFRFLKILKREDGAE